MKLTMGVTDNRNSVTFLTNPSRPTFLTDTSDRIVLSPRSYPQRTYHYSRHHEFVQHPSSWQHQFPQPFTPVIANSEHFLIRLYQYSYCRFSCHYRQREVALEIIARGFARRHCRGVYVWPYYCLSTLS